MASFTNSITTIQALSLSCFSHNANLLRYSIFVYCSPRSRPTALAAPRRNPRNSTGAQSTARPARINAVEMSFIQLDSSNSFGWTQTQGLEFLSIEVALHQGGLSISNQVNLTHSLALLFTLSVTHRVLLEGNCAAKQLKPITTATTGKSQGRIPGRSPEATSS